MLRALRATIASSPRAVMMNADADQRQEGDERQQRPVAHAADAHRIRSRAHRGNRYQVTSATTPISMAKA